MSTTARTSEYVSSVPMLTRQWLVEGYIWQCRGQCEHPPHDAIFVAVLPDDRTLVATALPVAPILAQHTFTAWPVAIHSDPSGQIPLAVLDSTGHYAQIESFRVPLDDDAPDASQDSNMPTFCRFLCGRTSGELHICPD